MQSVELRIVDLHRVMLPVNLLWVRAQAYFSDLVHQQVFPVAFEGLEALPLLVKGEELIFFVTVFADALYKDVVSLVFDNY